MTQETDIALIAQRLDLHIAECTKLGEENKERLETMHRENRENLEKILEAQVRMQSAFDQAKGAWRMIFVASGIIASIAAGVAWALNHITLKP